MTLKQNYKSLRLLTVLLLIGLVVIIRNGVATVF